jgi:hypothetical chaperone protein
MSVKVGIDFGTSNSGVAVFDGSRVRLLPIDRQNVMPEVVKTILYITRDYKHYIGQEAVELYYKHNVNRLRRFVRKWAGELEIYGADMFYIDDVYVYVDELKPGRLIQFIKTALRSKGYRGTQVFDRYYSLAEVVAAYLRELKKRAEAILHDEIDTVTLGRPVKFSSDPDQDQRSEAVLREAAYNAGFKQVDFEFEPIAAALFYEMTLEHPQNALIFDFGGGTLDLTILHLGDLSNRQVFASGGISIAGSDFDRAIIQKRLLPHFGQGQITHNRPDIQELIQAISDWMVLPDLSTPRIKASLEQAIRDDKASVQLKALESLIFNDLAFSFYNTVEASKIALSSQGATAIQVKEKNLDIWELYTRYQFEKDILEYQVQIEEVLLNTLKASGLEPGEIDAVVKTGGSSGIPAFTAILARIFGPERLKSSDTFSSVTAGLAIRAHQGSL